MKIASSGLAPILRKASCAAVAALSFWAVSASAQIIDVPFTGNTAWDYWEIDEWNYSPYGWSEYQGDYGAFPGNGPWGDTAPSSGGSIGRNGELLFVAAGTGGGPYIGGSSLYFGGTDEGGNIDGGTAGVFVGSPVADVKTISFQIQIGQAFGYDFFNNSIPTLFINGSTEISSTVQQLIGQLDNGSFTPPGQPTQPLFLNTYYFQWSVEEPVTSFEIHFNAVQHAQVYYLRIDQTDVAYNGSAIPEPSTYALLAMAGAAAAFRWRQRKA